MKYLEIYNDNGLSYFREINFEDGESKELGIYSKPISTKDMIFRESQKAIYDWHPAPRKQFIIYLSGKVKVEASGGDIEIFENGDILLANDISGKGHISEVIEDGISIVVRC